MEGARARIAYSEQVEDYTELLLYRVGNVLTTVWEEIVVIV